MVCGEVVGEGSVGGKVVCGVAACLMMDRITTFPVLRLYLNLYFVKHFLFERVFQMFIPILIPVPSHN